MTTAAESFKAGFVGRCKAAGLDDAAIAVCVATAADLVKSGGINDMLHQIPFYPMAEKVMEGAGERIPGMAMAGYLGVPALAGIAGGVGLAKLQDLNDEDPSEIRTRESIDEYRRLAREMAIKNHLRMSQPTRSRSPLVRG